MTTLLWEGMETSSDVICNFSFGSPYKLAFYCVNSITKNYHLALCTQSLCLQWELPVIQMFRKIGPMSVLFTPTFSAGHKQRLVPNRQCLLSEQLY